MKMFIEDIKNPFEDNGVSTLRLKTPTKTIEGLFRVFNGPEIRTWKAHHNNNLNLTSPIVEFTGSPVTSDVEKLKRQGFIVKYIRPFKYGFN
jgi:hypothetical protein